MSRFKVGDLVRYAVQDNNNQDFYYPKFGAVGEVKKVDGDGAFVVWKRDYLSERCWQNNGCAIALERGSGIYYYDRRLEAVDHVEDAAVEKPLSIGQWLKTRKNRDLARIFSIYADCNVCTVLMAKYGIQQHCDEPDGCWNAWKSLLQKERMKPNETVE